MVFGRRAGEITGTNTGKGKGAGAGATTTVHNKEKKKLMDPNNTEPAEVTVTPVVSKDTGTVSVVEVVDDAIVGGGGGGEGGEEELEEPSPGSNNNTNNNNNNVTDLLGLDTSAISLDGQSLIVPPVEQINVVGHISYDCDSEDFETAYEGDCVSSLGTGRYTYGGPPGVTTTSSAPPPPNHYYGSGGGGVGGGKNNFGASIGYIGDMRIIQQPHHHHPHHHQSSASQYFDANDDDDDNNDANDANDVGRSSITSATTGKKLPPPRPTTTTTTTTKTDNGKNPATKNSSSRHSRRSVRSFFSSDHQTQEQTNNNNDNDVSYCTTIGEDYSVRDVENGTIVGGTGSAASIGGVGVGVGGDNDVNDDMGDSMSYANSSIGGNYNNNNTTMTDVELNEETTTMTMTATDSPRRAKSQPRWNKKNVNTVMKNDTKKKKQNKKKSRTTTSSSTSSSTTTMTKKGTCGCIPSWLTNAPYWLKMVILGSLALLVGAIVLIGIGAWFATNNNNNSSNDGGGGGGGSSSSSLSNTSSGGSSTVPALPTTTSPPPPAGADEYDDDGVTIIGGQPEQEQEQQQQQQQQDTNPTTTVTSSPQQNVSTNPPMNSSRPATPSSTVSFYVMGGRFEDEGLAQLTTDLAQLPVVTTGTTTEPNYPVLFHLGDWNSPFSTNCDEVSFLSNVDTYKQSTVPVYFVIGDNEFNDCPDPDQAIGFWYNTLLDFENRYWPAPSWNVTRQLPDSAENFAFVQDRVLFVGMNLVGGIVHDQREWDNRHSSNLAWVDQAVTDNAGNFDVVVVLGHSDPDIEVNESFFTPFFQLVQTFEEHVFFVHRNLGIDSWQFEPARDGMSNVDVIVVEGSAWPPMFIEIDLANRALTIDQGIWFDDYVSSGELAFSSTALTSGF